MGIGKRVVKHKVKKSVNNATEDLLGKEDDKKLKKDRRKKRGERD